MTQDTVRYPDSFSGSTRLIYMMSQGFAIGIPVFGNLLELGRLIW